MFTLNLNLVLQVVFQFLLCLSLLNLVYIFVTRQHKIYRCL